MSSLVKLVTVANVIEAEIVHSLLESNGIGSVIKEPAVYHFPTSPLVRVIFVQEDDFELAQKIISSAGTAPE